MRSGSRRGKRSVCFALLALMTLTLAGCGIFQEPTQPEPPVLRPPRFAQTSASRSNPDRLVLSSIKLDTPIVELGWHPARTSRGSIFSQWDVAEYAAGWHKNSALPDEEGNVVLSAHNNILGSVFRELDQLKQGDEAVVWMGGRRFAYEVERVMIVPEQSATPKQRAENAAWIEPSDDARLTLVSCWPRDGNSHRIIVVARPVPTAQISRQ